MQCERGFAEGRRRRLRFAPLGDKIAPVLPDGLARLGRFRAGSGKGYQLRAP
jgi:hypothetical protein